MIKDIDSLHLPEICLAPEGRLAERIDLHARSRVRTYSLCSLRGAPSGFAIHDPRLHGGAQVGIPGRAVIFGSIPKLQYRRVGSDR